MCWECIIIHALLFPWQKAAESPAKEKEAVAASPEKETTPADDEVPDLVQQALAETVPEVTTENSKPADDSTEVC